MQASVLHIYSLGIVAANKALDSKVIEVTPIEDMPMVDGELSDNAVRYQAEGSGIEANNHYKLDVLSTVTLQATWLPVTTTNRVTAPDVRRGELVAIYQFADADKYFWTTIKDDLSLRRLETVIYAFSGTRDESAAVDADNYYFLEISTHKKIVHFHTSKADGEPFAYDIQLNTKDGFLVIQDDIGNTISLDSTNRRMEFKNAEDTHIDMDREDITITVKGNTTINTQTNTTVNTEGNTVIQTTGTNTIQGAQNILKGPTVIQGPLAVKGGGGGASVTVDGTMNVEHVVSPNTIDAPRFSGLAAGTYN